MEQTKEQLHAELRYAQRLCQRTARLYRRAQTISTFLSLVAGSAAIAALSAHMSVEVTVSFAIAFAVVSSINMAVRPADKIASNETDVRKYAALLAKSEQLDGPALRQLIAEARQSDAAEVEPLRDVAFNDVMYEINRTDALIPLRRFQRLLAMLA